MLKILVTGGYGFIGSALIRHILNTTNYKVVNVDALTYAGNTSSIPTSLKNKNYIFENINICDKEKINQLFKKHEPDIIMHLAAESHVDKSIYGPEEFIKTNILGTFNLLDCFKQYYSSLDREKLKKCVFHHISTDEVYGELNDNDNPFTESHPYHPNSPYSASKASSDHLVRAWGRTYGLPILISNCSNNYGPYHFPEKLIPQIILNAIHGKSLPIYGNGMQIRDWLYVEDHVKALLMIATKGSLGETYNVGGGNEKTNIEVVELICNILEKSDCKKPPHIRKYKDLITFIKDRPGHDYRYAIDSSKIQNELNWKPFETFESGLNKTVNWYLQNKEWWIKIYK